MALSLSLSLSVLRWTSPQRSLASDVLAHTAQDLVTLQRGRRPSVQLPRLLDDPSFATLSPGSRNLVWQVSTRPCDRLPVAEAESCRGFGVSLAAVLSRLCAYVTVSGLSSGRSHKLASMIHPRSSSLACKDRELPSRKAPESSLSPAAVCHAVRIIACTLTLSCREGPLWELYSDYTGSPQTLLTRRSQPTISSRRTRGGNSPLLAGRATVRNVDGTTDPLPCMFSPERACSSCADLHVVRV